MSPVDKVARLHQYQSAVVAPSVCFAVAFPFGCSLALTLCKDMQVGGCQIESTVGSAIYVRVAYATLFGYCVAADDGTGVVESCEVIAVAAQSHVQTMGVVAVEHHEICRLLFGINVVFVSCRCIDSDTKR